MSKLSRMLIAASIATLSAAALPAYAQTMHFNEGSATPNDAPQAKPVVHHRKKAKKHHHRRIPSSAANTNAAQRP
ncbi:hypothetical protein [Chitinasiproducens palmae]|uniref:Uncharacterized protein n=1 Tax=Chitinasiproducens palmae TaxID=1770053 RepID=A0A1H2PV07_9BURK|nr:hypothetical protein [Chitinasiproducens palmae]SDV51037.1 hypothetical protein SAMN05216551_114138 [Chitinasiproducens palmae]